VIGQAQPNQARPGQPSQPSQAKHSWTRQKCKKEKIMQEVKLSKKTN